MTERRLRDAVRALVLDEADRVLLVRFEFPRWVGWATPGGGVNSHETTRTPSGGSSPRRWGSGRSRSGR